MSESHDIIAYLKDRRRAVKRDLEMIDRLLRAAETAESESTGSGPAPQPARAAAVKRQRSAGGGRTPASRGGTGRYGRSVRAMVADVLRSENRWWTVAEIQDAVHAEVGPARADARLKDNVRASLYTLKKHGEADNHGDGSYMATVWLTDTDTAPDDAEAVSAPIPTTGAGGESGDPHQDHDHNQPGRHDRDHRKPAIVRSIG